MEVTDQNVARTCLCSYKMTSREVEGDEGVKLIECLRGRLLAQRQASRAAKEEEELMGQRLVEIEKKLREETRLRDKAEKKLKILKKKLEGFECPPLSCQVSCRLSSAECADGLKEMAPTMHNHHLAFAEDDCNPSTREKSGTINAKLPCNDLCSTSSTKEVATFSVIPDQSHEGSESKSKQKW